MISQTDVEKLLRHNHSELDLDSLVLIKQDIFGATYLVNTTHYFKFASCDMESQSIQTMANLLPKLSQHVDVTLPRVDYSGVLPGTHFHYMGVTSIPGEPVTREYFDSLGQIQQKKLLQSIATFLEQCHSFDPAAAIACGVEFTRRNWSASRFLARHSSAYNKELNSLLSSAENQPIITAQQTDHSDKSAADIPTINSVPQLLQFKLALLHNDFRDDHVYIDRRTGNVTGIIDFGNVALGDPFDDFVLLLLRMGEDFVEQLLAFYHTKEPAVLRAQLKHRDQLFG